MSIEHQAKYPCSLRACVVAICEAKFARLRQYVEQLIDCARESRGLDRKVAIECSNGRSEVAVSKWLRRGKTRL